MRVLMVSIHYNQISSAGCILTRCPELDKSRGSAKPGFGGSPFGSSSSSIPPEFTPLISAHQSASKLSIPLKATISAANKEYEKQTDSSTPVPSAPVYAARLNGLIKTLANAESAVAECVKAREGLVTGLEKLLEAQRAALDEDKQSLVDIQTRKIEIEDKKQQVEVAIMQALGPSENGSGVEGTSGATAEPDRPEMEALTPPPIDDSHVEAITPPTTDDGPQPAVEAPSGIEMLSNLASSYQSLPIATNGANKRRRVEDNEQLPNLGADDGIDADVAAMLKDGSA